MKIEARVKLLESKLGLPIKWFDVNDNPIDEPKDWPTLADPVEAVEAIEYRIRHLEVLDDRIRRIENELGLPSEMP